MGPIADGTGRCPANVRDDGCLDIRRRWRSSVGGEEMLGDGLGDLASSGGFGVFPLSKYWPGPGKVGTGDNLS